MKIILCPVFYFFNLLFCYSQADRTSFSLSEIKVTEISLILPPSLITRADQVSGITVIDARFDTSSYGLYQNYPNKYYSIASATNAADDIKLFLKDYLQVKTPTNSGVEKQIIMVIKKLWVTAALQEETVSEPGQAHGESGGVIAKFEFYCSNSKGYSPLYRFDTIVSGLKYIRKEAPEFISSVLALSVQRLLTTDLANVYMPEKMMSINEIIAYSKKQADVPIVTVAAYKKGVYKTFDEFKMNDPSILNYDIEKDRLTKTIFLNDGEGAQPARDLWGYCDGRHIYINSADNYFELIKNGNTFITNAARSISRKRGLKAGNVIMLGVVAGGIGRSNKKTTYSLSRKPYELDMENGELY